MRTLLVMMLAISFAVVPACVCTDDQPKTEATPDANAIPLPQGKPKALRKVPDMAYAPPVILPSASAPAASSGN